MIYDYDTNKNKVIQKAQYSRKIIIFKKIAASGERRLAGELKARPGASSYLAACMLGLVCHIVDLTVVGNQLRSLPRRTHAGD